MQTAEEPKIAATAADGRGHALGGRGDPRRWAWPALAAVLAGALALRVWGIGQGLPYVYNIDEGTHFVPKAIEMFERGSLNPHYFANPPAFSYLLHLVFAVWFGGATGAAHASAAHPTDVYILARATSAVLGTVAIWLLYLLGARLLGRAVGLLAAALEAVAFLPVFYAHLALNDVPTLAPLTLSLMGTAGVLRKGRLIDYVVAGVGLGLACATKYTAGIVTLPLIAAAATRYLDKGSPGGPSTGARTAAARQAASRGAVALCAAAIAFLIANPYALIDFHSFYSELVHQSSLSAEAQGKLGAPRQGGVLYYLWSLTWGLGWLPALGAVGGAIALWRSRSAADHRAVAWLLVPAPLLFLAFMGLQGRYFGRWLMPILPILCLLAAYFALRVAEAVAGRLQRALEDRSAASSRPIRDLLPRGLRVLVIGAVVLALCGQGLLYSVHSGLMLSRADTRNLTRAWMVAHVPVGDHIVVEPVAPGNWAHDVGRPTTGARNGSRWIKYAAEVSVIAPDGALDPRARKLLGIENYERTLSPPLLGYYERLGYCWVISGSTQSGRAFADQRAVPNAVAYYQTLARSGEVVYRASPYAHGKGPVAFGFDWSFDYYPLAYDRPGPEMTVYRLHGSRCGP